VTGILSPQPRPASARMPDHRGIRLPFGSLPRRFVPGVPARNPSSRRFGGPPLRAA
jgi:hypothetical protein